MLGGYEYDVFCRLRDSVFSICENHFCRYIFNLLSSILNFFEKAVQNKNSNAISSLIMLTTRSQKRKNKQQGNNESVSGSPVSPIVVENPCSLDQDVSIAGPSRSKSPRIENSMSENLFKGRNNFGN